MKNKIIQMLQSGNSYNDIIKAVGCSRPTISYHAKKLGITSPRMPSSVRFNWESIASYYKTHTYTETKQHFGFAGGSWKLAVERGDIISRGYADRNIPDDQIFCEQSTYNRADLKKRIIKDNIVDNVCHECGQLPTWNGKELILQLDHINGVNNDNRKNNLRLLCPNCHTQTDTFAGRNIANK